MTCVIFICSALYLMLKQRPLDILQCNNPISLIQGSRPCQIGLGYYLFVMFGIAARHLYVIFAILVHTVARSYTYIHMHLYTYANTYVYVYMCKHIYASIHMQILIQQLRSLNRILHYSNIDNKTVLLNTMYDWFNMITWSKAANYIAVIGAGFFSVTQYIL